jgi:DNA-binding PadR family transcriptional regulator
VSAYGISVGSRVHDGFVTRGGFALILTRFASALQYSFAGEITGALRLANRAAGHRYPQMIYQIYLAAGTSFMAEKSGRADENNLRELLPLTPAVFFILLALSDGEKHGYAVMQLVSEQSGQKVRMGPGTLYSTIQRLLDLQLIEEVRDGGPASERDSRRRYYRLSGGGKAVLEAELGRIDDVVRLARRKKLIPRTG